VNVLFDGAGHWHGSSGRLEIDDSFEDYVGKVRGFRYNTLFGDLHAKSLTFNEIQQAWQTEL